MQTILSSLLPSGATVLKGECCIGEGSLGSLRGERRFKSLYPSESRLSHNGSLWTWVSSEVAWRRQRGWGGCWWRLDAERTITPRSPSPHSSSSLPFLLWWPQQGPVTSAATSCSSAPTFPFCKSRTLSHCCKALRLAAQWWLFSARPQGGSKTLAVSDIIGKLSTCINYGIKPIFSVAALTGRQYTQSHHMPSQYYMNKPTTWGKIM